MTIVLGLASSHSPNVSTVPELWRLHADRDRRNPHLDFAGLAAAARPELAAELSLEVFQRKHEACQAAIGRLAEAFVAADPDVVVVIGDDQRELFRDECTPAFAVYTGRDLVDIPAEPETFDPSIRPALWARHAAQTESYATDPDFARALVQSLGARGFDMAVAGAQLPGRSLGHAFTFVRLRLMGAKTPPMIPVFINTYFPPNQPSPRRCWEFGRALRRALDGFGDRRVALVASGGLSHFIIDEELDRRVLAAIMDGRSETLGDLPADKLNGGSSEIRNWIAASAAMQDLAPKLLAYEPAYRSEAGTGCGMAFMRWEPPIAPAPRLG
ncbi:MAG TPA: hypothetical protein VMU56_06055 [Beijerinckiaceae bacterium]|nr:hypothetical protein [Beijerinckiaceae bacterium]